MTRPSAWVAVVAALILITGAFQLNRAGYSVDEEFTVFAVRGIQAQGLPLLPSGLLYDRGLAYSYAGGIAGGLSGTELPSFRALSLLCALASIVLTFANVRRLTTERTALLAATLVSMSMPFWTTATTGRFYAPFLAVYLIGLYLMSQIHVGGLTRRTVVSLVITAAIGRWLHELEFTVAGIPVLCAVFGPRIDRRKWLVTSAAVLVGLAAAQATLFVLHALEPGNGETMVRRFFLWQVLNLFEVPADRQYGVVLAVMVMTWLVVPARAALAAVIALCATAMVIAFSLASATNVGPLSVALVTMVLSDGASYPLAMFRHIAAVNPVTTTAVLAGLVARLAGAGGEWRPHERAAHLLWMFWVLWFGALRDSVITSNYLLLPVSLMLMAVAIDLDAITRHVLPPVLPASRRLAAAVLVLAGLAVGVDQWRGTGTIAERIVAARPTINIPGMDEMRAGLAATDRIACTDELACLVLVGRIDYWLALDDFVRERFLVTMRDGTMAGVYTGVPAVFRPAELFAPNPDGTLPDRVLVVDVFKEHAVGNSRSWLPRAIEFDGLQVTPLLESPQARVLQISPAERNALRQPWRNHPLRPTNGGVIMVASRLESSLVSSVDQNGRCRREFLETNHSLDISLHR